MTVTPRTGLGASKHGHMGVWNMIEAVIMGLIYLCVLVIAIYLIIWVLQQLGIAIPENVMKIIWVIVVLVAILILVRTILPGMGVRLGAVEWLLNHGGMFS